jgi:hypothetical protein
MTKRNKQQLCECGRHTWRPNGVCVRCVEKMQTLLINLKKEYGINLWSIADDEPKRVYDSPGDVGIDDMHGRWDR